ncbi:GAF domain-containing protein [Nocardia sp. NPDC088792]|uniref:GAF domain-containing protein n=1 Tax=Nocardia sp. NPDC088792 TaxID=3364332 RepID=UPI00380338D3
MTEPKDELSPSPANMPARISRCQHATSTHVPRHWAVIETLDEGSEGTVIADGPHPRRFSKLNRVSLAPTIGVVRRIHPVIAQCVADRRFVMETMTLACGASIKIVGVPILGPYGHVRAVCVWIGEADAALPPVPDVGVLEWDAAVVVAASVAARTLLLGDESVETSLLPDMLSNLDRFESRSDFLALLSLDDPIDEWIGSATRTFSDGTPHRLQIAARADGAGPGRRVRAVVCEVVDGTQTRLTPEMYLRAMRHVPILPGHALAMVDLNAKVIHDWIATDGDPMAGWCHHRPLLHPDDQVRILATCEALLVGSVMTASVRGRIRFDPGDEWIELESRWTRIMEGDQPQALVHIAVIPPLPTSIVDDCPRCRRAADSAA